MSEPPVKFWSFSSLMQFEKCPYSVYLQRVEKSPGPPPRDDDPRERGNRIHKDAELFIQGDGGITPLLKKIEPQLEAARTAYSEGRAQVEQMWKFDTDWTPTEWGTHWSLVKCDLVEDPNQPHMTITDWKSGKSWGNEVKHGMQMQHYAVHGFLKYPDTVMITTRLVYTDEGAVRKKVYTRDGLPALAERWKERALKLTTATTFKPKPNKSNCKWCDFGPNDGTGACPYGVEDPNHKTK
jgi:hypothetical protein